jgi:hypothetical protein
MDTLAIGNWRQSQTCVDYVVYVRDLPSLDHRHWQDMVARMRTLGTCQDTAIGVTTVRGAWGFFQIPAPGFPELKATFFQTSEPAERSRLLTDIADILETTR